MSDTTTIEACISAAPDGSDGTTPTAPNTGESTAIITPHTSKSDKTGRAYPDTFIINVNITHNNPFNYGIRMTVPVVFTRANHVGCRTIYFSGGLPENELDLSEFGYVQNGDSKQGHDGTKSPGIALKIIPEEIKNYLATFGSNLVYGHHETGVNMTVGIRGVYEKGNGDMWVFMDRVKGRNMAAYAPRNINEQTPTNLESIMDMLSQAAVIEANIHNSGNIDRDIKPSNYMVEDHKNVAGWPGKTTRHVVRVDLDSISPESHEAGAVFTTIEYAAPETIGMSIQNKKSDVYAFGVMVYEMLTGETLMKRRWKADHAGDTLSPVERSIGYSELSNDVKLEYARERMFDDEYNVFMQDAVDNMLRISDNESIHCQFTRLLKGMLENEAWKRPRMDVVNSFFSQFDVYGGADLRNFNRWQPIEDEGDNIYILDDTEDNVPNHRTVRAMMADAGSQLINAIRKYAA